MRDKSEILVCIPSKRLPPLTSLELHLERLRYPILLISDPDVFEIHRQFYDGSKIDVIRGEHGVKRQTMRCYSEAADRGYQHFFRMDDDYIPGVFYQLEKQLDVDINDIIEQAHRCLLELNVSYVGFMNTKNPRELRPSFSKTHGHLAGAAVMAISTKTPETFMSLDPDLAGVHEDLYRTCAHRRYERDVLGGRGENGRVNFIGATWAGCFGKNTSIVSTQEGIYRSENFLSQEFPDMITFIDGSEYVNVLGFEKRKKRYLKSW